MTIIGRNRGRNLPVPSENKHPPLADPPPDEFAFATQFALAEKSPATRRAYRSDFNIFRNWCVPRKLSMMPAVPFTVATFLAMEVKRGMKASTIERRLFAIAYAHVLAGHQSPSQSEAVKVIMRGIRRTIGTAPNRKEPITAERIRVMAKAVPGGLIGLRDCALLEAPGGLRVRIRGSKTDQEQRGQVIGVARGKSACPVMALRAWLKASGIVRGPIFRSICKGGTVSTKRLSDHTVTKIVKRYAEQTGIDPSTVSAHSVRAGFLTSAAQQGASIFRLMDVSRHKSVDTLSGYIRNVELFKDHAGEKLL